MAECAEVIHKTNKNRQASIELLRSVAMIMVITLHYLDKGGILVPLSETQTFQGYLAWVLEAFCIVAVNTYVLVSGYFLVESGFKLKRLVLLAAQILFYSVLVPAVLACCGIIPFSDITLYHLLNYFLPVQMNHYWFGTAYLLMYLFVPVLSAGVKKMSEKQLKSMIFLLLLVFSLSKTFLPFQLEIDHNGNDVVWFLCLFLVAAYFRLYGLKKMKKSVNGWILYGISCTGIFALSVFIACLSRHFGKFKYFIDSPYSYNHVLCLLGSVGLFYAFLQWDMKEGRLARLARKIGPYTFGVYLLHENLEIRYLWPRWLGVEHFKTGSWSLLHWLVSVLLVFSIGIFVDFLRSRIFHGVEKIIYGKTE